MSTKTVDDDHCFRILCALETMDPDDPDHVAEAVTDCIGWAAEGHVLAHQRAAVRGTWTVSLPEVSRRERTLLLLLIKNRDWIEKAGERMGPSDLEEGANRVIFEALIADPELAVLPEGTAPEAVRRFEQHMTDPETLASPAQVFDDALAAIEGNRIDRRLAANAEELRRTGPEEQGRLIRDRQQLISGLGGTPRGQPTRRTR